MQTLILHSGCLGAHEKGQSGRRDLGSLASFKGWGTTTRWNTGRTVGEGELKVPG